MIERISDFVAEWPSITRLAIAVGLGIIAAGIAYSIAFRLVEWTVHNRPHSVRAVFIKRVKAPTRLLLPLLVVRLVVGAVAQSGSVAGLDFVLTLATLGALGWLLVELAGAFYDVVALRHSLTEADNLQARRVLTQAMVLYRIAVVGIVIVTAAMMLMAIPQVRTIGLSLFASAGLAGLAAGLAARPVLSNLIAGLQVALTQPFRIDDVVIIDGEWGRIEEIGTAYVVVRIWDMRRLIVPLSRFIEQPFQNWTRTSSALLGTVFLYTDYRVPVDELRSELQRICEGSPLWDRQVCMIQVTDAKERTIELRALVSSADSGSNWDLRCLVREGLIRFLADRHPDSLPRVRLEADEPLALARQGEDVEARLEGREPRLEDRRAQPDGGSKPS